MGSKRTSAIDLLARARLELSRAESARDENAARDHACIALQHVADLADVFAGVPDGARKGRGTPRDREGGATLLIALADQIIGGTASIYEFDSRPVTTYTYNATGSNTRFKVEVLSSDPVGLQHAIDETSQDLKQLGAMSADRRVQHAERMAMKWGGLYEDLVMMTSSSHGPMRPGNPRDHVELRRTIKATAREVKRTVEPHSVVALAQKLECAARLADAVILYLGGPVDE